MDRRENAVHRHHGILFRLTKDRSSDIGFNLDEPGGDGAKGNKLVMREHTWYESASVRPVGHKDKQ